MPVFINRFQTFFATGGFSAHSSSDRNKIEGCDRLFVRQVQARVDRDGAGSYFKAALSTVESRVTATL
jgi:hypothetical protein